MANVRIENVEKRFGDVRVLHQISLTVPSRSLVTLLGPSGCGKTTLLRIVAGLERSDGGIVAIHEKVVSDTAHDIHVPSAQRNVGMVFQSYALWPHKRIWENVAYPLRVRKIAEQELRDRAHQALALVQLEHLAERFPGELSGGQQQRVAIARAVVYEPELLLLDEPLSNLDAKLRAEMRFEIRELQQRCKLTTLYVTHDQEEAFVISDHICLMNGGRLEQMGSALELYEQPRSCFVADFVGTANTLSGEAHRDSSDGGLRIQLAPGWGVVAQTSRSVEQGKTVSVLVRPEEIQLYESQRPEAVSGSVRSITYLGGSTEYAVTAPNATLLRVRAPGSPRFHVGQDVYVGITKSIVLAT